MKKFLLPLFLLASFAITSCSGGVSVETIKEDTANMSITNCDYSAAKVTFYMSEQSPMSPKEETTFEFYYTFDGTWTVDASKTAADILPGASTVNPSAYFLSTYIELFEESEASAELPEGAKATVVWSKNANGYKVESKASYSFTEEGANVDLNVNTTAEWDTKGWPLKLESSTKTNMSYQGETLTSETLTKITYTYTNN